MTIRPYALGISLALAFAHGTALAQTSVAPAPPTFTPAPAATSPAPVTVTPAPEPVRPPAVIEPAARLLLNQMIAAHKGLHSFVITLDIQEAADSKLIPGGAMRSRISYRAPAMASVQLTKDGKSVGQFISNGKTFYGVSVAQKKYVKNAMPPQVVGQFVSAQVGRVGFVPQALVNPDGLTDLMSAQSLSTMMTSPAPSTVAGVAADTLVASLTDPSGRAATFTFSIGQADHILRRIIIQQTQVSPTPGGASRTVTHTETISALKINPVLGTATFAYTPPAGYVKTK